MNYSLHSLVHELGRLRRRLVVLHLHEVVHDEGVADLLAREDLAAGEGDDVVASLIPR